MTEDVRLPAEAGRFYPAGEREARRELQRCFDEAGRQVEGPDRAVRGLVVPHAGWVFSGVVAAAGVSLVATDREWTVYLLGASHRYRLEGPAVWTEGAFRTPLGDVEISALAEELAKKDPFTADRRPHRAEHSLEVVLPFLQFRLGGTFRIVPVLFDAGDYATALRAGSALAEFWDSASLMVVSSDFSHYPSYDDAVSVDRRTLEAILTADPQRLLEETERLESEGVDGLDTCACGLSAILAVLVAARGASGGPLRPVPVLYRNSGDSAYGGRDRVVGYHAVAFREEV